MTAPPSDAELDALDWVRRRRVDQVRAHHPGPAGAHSERLDHLFRR